jgi:hypothetical protein
MVFADQVFYIHGPPTHLLSVHVANQRLLADRIFLAHAAAYGRLLFLQDGNSEGFFTAATQMDGKDSVRHNENDDYLVSNISRPLTG